MENLFFLTDKFEEFFQFWKSLDKDCCGEIPSKSALNPKDFVGLLDHVALFEIKGPTKAIARITGTGLDKILGRNITGKNMYDFYNKVDFENYKKLHESVLGGPCGVMSIREITLPDGDNQLLRSIGLPLCGEEGKPSYVFAIYEFDKEPITHLLTENGPFEYFINFDYKLFDLKTGSFIS
jgi:hypothetical protein